MREFLYLTTELSRCRRLRSLVLLSTLGCFAPSLAAQATQQSSTKSGQQAVRAANSGSRYLHVAINAATAKIIEGALYGLDAEFENVSNVVITIDLKQLQLAVQPELAPPNVSCTWFYDASNTDKLPSRILMQPGDHYTIFFDTGAAAQPKELKDSPECEAGYWSRLRRQLDFVPGNFAFVLTGTFTFTPAVINSVAGSATPDPSASTNPEEHYFAETASLPVTIDQSQMIIYAALGGFLAFLVMSIRNPRPLSESADNKQAASKKPLLKTAIFMREAAAAILLSVTVTVIAGRLSTTSFPVKVSVDDFWGALTVGFVSYFIGGKFIDKLSETLTPSPQTGPAAPPAAPAPVRVPVETPRGD